MSENSFKTQTIRNLCKSLKHNKQAKVILKKLLDSVPSHSNYSFDSFEEEPNKYGLVEMKTKFKPSNSPIKEHLRITNLNSKCRIKLNEKQAKWIKTLQSLNLEKEK